MLPDSVKKFIQHEKNIVLYEKLPIPDVTVNSISICRELCKENKCGFYGKSGTCPPAIGTVEECIDKVNRYEHAAMLVQTIEDIDVKNKEHTFQMTSIFQNTCRMIMCMLKEEKYEVLALTCGPCTYCEVCSNPKGKTCKYPDLQVPSMSGFGIVIKEYAKKIGLDFSFCDNKMTLYGILMYSKDEKTSL